MYYNESTLVYLDGQWLHPKSLDCSLYSQTLHYGIGVFEGIRAYKTPRGAKIYRGRAHYQRLLDYIKPDKVHVLAAGRIVKTGGPDLAHRLEAEGYDGILGEAV